MKVSMLMRPLACLGAAALCLSAAAGGGSINFEEFPADNDNGTIPPDRYAGIGVTFVGTDDSSTWAGNSNGDPGGWDLEGTNGPAFAGFNGASYGVTVLFDSDVSGFSLDVSRSSGSSDGDVTVEGYNDGLLVDSMTVTLGDINIWSTLSLNGSIDEVVLFGTGSGFHPFGVDNLQWSAGSDCPWDLNNDGVVGPPDLAALLAGWGNPYGPADLAALLAAWGPCNVCGPGAGPCDQPNGTPGCEDVECCELICSQDPFCCDVEWDQLCADAAIEQCGAPDPVGACCVGADCLVLTAADCAAQGGEYFGDGSACTPELCAPPAICGPGAGPCNQPNGTPGCEDVECCELICSQDPFCCDNQWDQLCANQAIEQCGAFGACCLGVDCLVLTAADCAAQGGEYFGDGSACTPDLCTPPAICGPGAGPCDEPNGTPGCDDVECCELICSQDPFCCDNQWDQICANAAINQCDAPDPVGACCLGVDCLVLTAADCAAQGGDYFGDGSACTPELCAPPACDPDAGSCVTPNGTPGCEDIECCELICSQDPFCCDVEWDQICATSALNECFDGGGDCCDANGTPGCNDPTCVELICSQDPFCCDNTWDQLCADAANKQCDVCQP